MRRSQAPDGWWADFDTLAGASDEWVTAFVASVLASPGIAAAGGLPMAQRAWRALSRRRWWSAGRGYNGSVPADADSTGWFALLAEGLGHGGSLAARRARRFLHSHMRPGGGIATYALARPIRLFTGLRRISFDGWCDQHTCVTAAVAQLAEFRDDPRIHSFLCERQRNDGAWGPYWWIDAEYATALAATALVNSTNERVRAAAERGSDWLAVRIGSDGPIRTSWYPSGSPFATAWALWGRRALVAREEPGLKAAAAWLASAQRADGSWEPSALLRIPPPDIVDPGSFAGWRTDTKGGGSIRVDQQAVFTTATVLRALANARD